MEDIIIIDVSTSEPQRIDSYIAGVSDDFSRNHIQKLIEDGCVLLNGSQYKSKKKVTNGDRIEIHVPLLKETQIEKENIPLEIIYQDSYMAVINKQQGLTVHPSNGCYTNTLVNALLYHFNDLSGLNGDARPGIVHRLDKNTSGLMLVAKNDIAHRILAEQIASKTCRRIYYALVEGVIKEDSGVINKNIGRSDKDRKLMTVTANGRTAETHYTVIKRYRNNTLVKFELKTGRTHQIRVHSKYIGHPVVGDQQYGFKNQKYKLNGQLLHSKEIHFIHPITKEEMYFESQLPDYFKKVIDTLDKTESID